MLKYICAKWSNFQYTIELGFISYGKTEQNLYSSLKMFERIFDSSILEQIANQKWIFKKRKKTKFLPG